MKRFVIVNRDVPACLRFLAPVDFPSRWIEDVKLADTFPSRDMALQIARIIRTEHRQTAMVVELPYTVNMR